MHVLGCTYVHCFSTFYFKCMLQNYLLYRYEQFHMAVLEEVRGGPEMVQKELDWYSTALCQYLKVSRTPLKVPDKGSYYNY